MPVQIMDTIFASYSFVLPPACPSHQQPHTNSRCSPARTSACSPWKMTYSRLVCMPRQLQLEQKQHNQTHSSPASEPALETMISGPPGCSSKYLVTSYTFPWITSQQSSSSVCFAISLALNVLDMMERIKLYDVIHTAQTPRQYMYNMRYVQYTVYTVYSIYRPRTGHINILILKYTGNINILYVLN